MKRLAGLVLLIAGAPLFAHDFWIEPTTFHPRSGETVGLALRVGEKFRGDPVPRNPESIEKFVAVSRGDEKGVEGVTGRDPAGIARVADPGYVVVGYRSRPRPIELAAGKFEGYLKEEGLEKVVAIRASRGQSERPGREIYSRCAKTLLDVDGAGSTGYDRVIGLRLEIVPERGPKELGGGRSLPVRLEFEGKPLTGALVVATNRDAPEKALSARTDASGRVAFDLAPSGVWLVKAVHMVPAPAASGSDWESLWASLTFEIP